jgi:DNA-binding CsgD family transcriptional regulator
MTLSEKAKKKIDELTPALEAMPGVVIIHELSTQAVVYMSKSGLETLDTTVEKLQAMGKEYYERYFNPEDAEDYVPKILGMLERNNNEETVSFFQQVRRSPDYPWSWYVSGTRIFMHDDEGKPYLTITVAMPIDAKHYFTAKIERLLEENNMLKENNTLFASMTKREKEIIRLIALGKNSADMANELHLSEETIKTHRRNIKRKLKLENHYEVLRFAQTFNLI